jgi:hypothetical protein
VKESSGYHHQTVITDGQVIEDGTVQIVQGGGDPQQVIYVTIPTN